MASPASPRIIAATPSPPPNLHMPPTPKHGYADSWEPFSPRKSSRIAAAAAAAAAASAASAAAAATATTASDLAHPPAPATPRRSGHSARGPLRSPKPSKALFHSAISPESTPRKKKMHPAATPEVAPAPAHATAHGKLAATRAQAQVIRNSLGMLPTPAKTPSKKVHAASQNESNIAAIARNLFHTDVDEVMASPTRARKSGSRSPKKYAGISLESFSVVEDEEAIAIFTDSQDRIPEADGSSDNPFYGNGATKPPPAVPEPTARRRSKRNHVSIPGEGKQSVEEAMQRDDGLVYVFRGKRIFRKYADTAEDSPDGSPGHGSPESALGRRLTRSSMKPRLLFPRDSHKTAAESTLEDEEALTDIECAEEAPTDIEEEVVEVEKAEKAPKTLKAPKAPEVPSTPPRTRRAAPVSPPVTGRTTRAKKRSPFDGWRQTKSGVSAAGHKRAADPADVPATVKRSRV